VHQVIFLQLVAARRVFLAELHPRSLPKLLRVLCPLPCAV
jgi:hypothetical protein